MYPGCRLIRFASRPFGAPEETSKNQPRPGRTTGKSQVQTTSCCNATAGNVDDWKFPKKPLIAPSLAIAADDMPGYAAPPKKRGTAWRPACRDPSLQTTTSFPEGSKGNRSSRWDSRSLVAGCLPPEEGWSKRKKAGLALDRRFWHRPSPKRKALTENNNRRSMTERVDCPHFPKKMQPPVRTAGGRNP